MNRQYLADSAHIQPDREAHVTRILQFVGEFGR